MNELAFGKENELVDCVVAMINSEGKLLGFLHDQPMCIRDEFSSEEQKAAYEAVKLSHDNDFCRVRELLREIKQEPHLLQC